MPNSIGTAPYFNHAYNALNQMTQVTDPKGNITQYTYDTNGNLTRLKHTGPGSASIGRIGSNLYS